MKKFIIHDNFCIQEVPEDFEPDGHENIVNVPDELAERYEDALNVLTEAEDEVRTCVSLIANTKENKNG